MADKLTTLVTEQPTEQALFADRQAFWKSFTRFATIAAAVVVSIVIALRLFLV